MKVIEYTHCKDHLLLRCTKGNVKIIPYTDSIIRIRYTLADNFTAKESLMIEQDAQQEVAFSISETSNDLLFATNNVGIRIDKSTAAFTYMDASGQVLVKEPKRGGKTLVPVEVAKSVFDDDTEIESTQNADGARVRAVPTTQVIDRKAYQTKLALEFADDEALYGLGSHEEGVFNLRGTHQYLYQQNMKAVVPVLVSTKGYGLLFDSYSLMKFHDDIHGSYIWTDVDSEMDYYFIYGPEFDQIVSGYRHLTGQVPLLPKWAFGYVQSKERYKTQEELISIVKEYRRRQIPLDVIILDWMSWEGDLWGQKSFDPERFPNPTQMTQEIHDLQN